MSGSSGRGPTMDMSPRSTLKSCGSSSILVRRSQRPSGNTLGSFCPVIRLAGPGGQTAIVRSLNMVKAEPSRPTRRARYSTGPGLVSRMARAARPSTGATSARPSPASTTSMRRLAMAMDTSHGHENLGGVHAAAVAPRLGADAECLERAGMRISAQLGLITRHGGDLRLERLADVHPRVGNEAAREGPLRAAGGVERVHGADAILGRAGGDERGLEEQLVVTIDVAAVLTIDQIGPKAADQLLERRHDVGERDRVESLIGEAEVLDFAQPERLRRAGGVLRLADPARSVAERFALAGDRPIDLVSRASMERDGAAAPQYFVVRVRGDDQDPTRRRRAHRRWSRLSRSTADRSGPGL